MTSKQQISKPALPVSLVTPMLLGLGAFIILFTLINREVITNETVLRYVAGHTVSKVTTALFFVGLAAVGMIAWNVFSQRSSLSRISLQNKKRRGEESALSLEQLQQRLEKIDESLQATYLWRRLQTALSFVHRNGAPDGLDEELKYASELDQEERQDRYSFVRIMIWAIPMLGFLGTVLGISEALGGIEIGDDNNFQQMMGGLRASLYVAFDTTAIALTFAILLMFLQFAVDRFEGGLLARVEVHARYELSQHWSVTNQTKDSYVKTVEAIGQSMLASTENLVERQIKLWRSNIHAAELAWVESIKAAQEAVRENLSEALEHSTDKLGANLQETIERSNEAVGQRWDEWQVALSENAKSLEHSTDKLGANLQETIERSNEAVGQRWEEWQVALSNNAKSLENSTEKLAANLQESIQRSDEAVGRRWEQWQVALSENARLLLGHQEQLVEHSKNMNRAVDQVGDLAEAKQMLAEHITSMPSTDDFAHATRQLSTAVRILEFRLKELTDQDQADHNLRVVNEQDERNAA